MTTVYQVGPSSPSTNPPYSQIRALIARSVRPSCQTRRSSGVRKPTRISTSQLGGSSVRRSRRIAGLQPHYQSASNTISLRQRRSLRSHIPAVVEVGLVVVTASIPLQATGLPPSTTINSRFAGSTDFPRAEEDSTVMNASSSRTAISRESLNIHSQIKKTILEPLTQAKRNATKPGYIYVFQDPKRRHLCKIGKAREVGARAERIESACGLDGLEVWHRGPSTFFEQRVEKLCQDELKDFRREYDCTQCKSKKSCPKRHREWFEVSKELATLVVEKWTEFMLMEPYDSKGELRGFWKDRLNNPGERYLTKEEASSPPEEYLSTHAQWSKYVNIGFFDKPRYEWRRFSKDCRGWEYWRYWLLSISYFSIFTFSLQALFGLQMIPLHIFFALGTGLPSLLVKVSVPGSAPSASKRSSCVSMSRSHV
jgi:hypothetical protein